MGCSRVLCLWALLVGFAKAEGSCTNGPVWLFSLPDDLKSIFQGLNGEYGVAKVEGAASYFAIFGRAPEPFVIIRSGEVTSLLADANLASIIALPIEVSEFPLVWCNAGKEVRGSKSEALLNLGYFFSRELTTQ